MLSVAGLLRGSLVESSAEPLGVDAGLLLGLREAEKTAHSTMTGRCRAPQPREGGGSLR